MIQFKPNPLGNDVSHEVSQSGLVKLQRIADRQAGHKRWLGMAGRRIAAVYPDHARWICLRVMTGREKAVEAALEALDIEAMVPTRKGPEYRRRGRVIPPADIPVLIGYTLVRCVPSATAMAGLNTIEHVIGVLGGWEAPVAINAEFIKRYRQKAADGGYDYDRPGIAVRKGQKVTIAEGPFGGIEGTVLTAPSGTIGDAVVEFSMMGRTVAMVVPLAILESV